MMNNAVVVTILLVIGHNMLTLSQCPNKSKGFLGCECNILGACNVKGKPTGDFDKKMSDYAPEGFEQFGYTDSPHTFNLAYLCEGSSVPILYDCNARIPLYAATRMTGDQLKQGYERGNPDFRSSPLLEIYFQQTKDDYKDSNSRNICFASSYSQDYEVDNDWYKDKNGGGIGQKPCSNKQLECSIHKGHLIAASYSRGNLSRILATFKYTNAIPQFGRFNSGPWMQAEKYLFKWGKDNCAITNSKNVQMFIVVGVIPSTFGGLSPRFFGQSGFSDFQGKFSAMPKNEEYRVNVPYLMWTAACCTFQFEDAQGQLQDRTRSVAFFRRNHPGSEKVKLTTPGELITWFTKKWPNIKTPQFFPQNLDC